MAGRSRLPLIATLALGSGAGYYLYSAGGKPKVAEKQMEHDAARLSSKIKGDLPGKGKEFKTEAKLYGEEAGAKIDDTIAAAKSKTRDIDAKLEAYRADAEKNLEKYKKEAGKELNSAVDKFDKTVEDAAAKTKSGISGWFGGK
ncbi:hypothetical protein MBLNU459_g0701t1 [Dothideomycetes sp. NU459]